MAGLPPSLQQFQTFAGLTPQATKAGIAFAGPGKAIPLSTSIHAGHSKHVPAQRTDSSQSRTSLKTIRKLGHGVALLVDAARQHSAVDYDGVAVGEAGCVTGEIDRRADEFFCLAEATHGVAHLEFCAAG